VNQLSDYDYHLPEHLIAQTPLEDRAASRLLHLDRFSGAVVHRQFRDVPSLFRGGDLLVANETRVTALRLFGKRAETEGRIEALLLRPEGPFAFEAMVRPAKRLRLGERVEFEQDLTATVTEVRNDGIRQLTFDPTDDLWERLQRAGETPLPPYIHAALASPERYQTVYASGDPGQNGSAAAPTAGLHFTPEILEEMRKKGIQIAMVRLDVGIDTFRPVTAESLDDHQMHGEVARIPEETAEAISACKGRIIAVGTTTVRTLESFAEGKGRVRSGETRTSLFIRPGYEFQVIDGMFTNFHLPRTTMLAMISALAGHESVFAAYESAIKEQYRFLSFVDSMLIL